MEKANRQETHGNADYEKILLLSANNSIMKTLNREWNGPGVQGGLCLDFQDFRKDLKLYERAYRRVNRGL